MSKASMTRNQSTYPPQDLREKVLLNNNKVDNKNFEKFQNEKLSPIGLEVDISNEMSTRDKYSEHLIKTFEKKAIAKM